MSGEPVKEGRQRLLALGVLGVRLHDPTAGLRDRVMTPVSPTAVSEPFEQAASWVKSRVWSPVITHIWGDTDHAHRQIRALTTCSGELAKPGSVSNPSRWTGPVACGRERVEDRGRVCRKAVTEGRRGVTTSPSVATRFTRRSDGGGVVRAVDADNVVQGAHLRGAPTGGVETACASSAGLFRT